MDKSFLRLQLHSTPGWLLVNIIRIPTLTNVMTWFTEATNMYQIYLKQNTKAILLKTSFILKLSA